MIICTRLVRTQHCVSVHAPPLQSVPAALLISVLPLGQEPIESQYFAEIKNDGCCNITCVSPMPRCCPSSAGRTNTRAQHWYAVHVPPVHGSVAASSLSTMLLAEHAVYELQYSGGCTIDRLSIRKKWLQTKSL